MKKGEGSQEKREDLISQGENLSHKGRGLSLRGLLLRGKREIVDAKSIERIAHLARLKITPAEQEGFTHSINRILHFISQLNEVDTDQVSPLVNISRHPMEHRADEVTEAPQLQALLQNAPQNDQNMFVVPKVV